MASKLLQKIRTTAKEARSAWEAIPDERRLLALLRREHRFPEGEGKILVQAADSYRFLAAFVCFLKAWNARNPGGFRLDLAWPLIPFRSNRSFKSFLYQEKGKQALHRRKWLAFYRALGGTPAFDNGRLPALRPGIAASLRQNAPDAERLLLLQYRGILIGDLVYDTYLRFRSRATVDFADPFLDELLEWAARLVEGYLALFAKERYIFYLSSYGSYLHHGIPVRTALASGVPVYSMGARLQLISRPSADFPFHTRDYRRYRTWASALPAEERARAIARGHEGLAQRLGGKKDAATNYMRQSAYAVNPAFDANRLLPPKTGRTILVLGHDFFDSPHDYGLMLYPDFYFWIKAVLEELCRAGDEVLVKPHPNGIAGNELIWAEIASRFPEAHFLPSEASTLQLVERGLDLALTVYGTVAHELAYLGVPVLCAGANPHQSFHFCTTPTDRARYLAFLREPSSVPKPEPRSDEVALFYYVHSYRTFGGETSLFPFQATCRDATDWLVTGTPEFERRLQGCARALERVDEL